MGYQTFCLFYRNPNFSLYFLSSKESYICTKETLFWDLTDMLRNMYFALVLSCFACLLSFQAHQIQGLYDMSLPHKVTSRLYSKMVDELKFLYYFLHVLSAFNDFSLVFNFVFVIIVYLALHLFPIAGWQIHINKRMATLTSPIAARAQYKLRIFKIIYDIT